MSTGGIQSAGAPGIPEPAAGTKTAFLSSVKLTHCSTKLCSLSTSCSFLSVKKVIKSHLYIGITYWVIHFIEVE